MHQEGEAKNKISIPLSSRYDPSRGRDPQSESIAYGFVTNYNDPLVTIRAIS